MMRAFKGTGDGNAAYYPLADLGPLLMFEDMDDAYAFLSHCGLEMVVVGDEDDAADQGYAVVLSSSRDISEMLPVDKNGHPIPPTVSPMLQVHITPSSSIYHTLSYDSLPINIPS